MKLLVSILITAAVGVSLFALLPMKLEEGHGAERRLGLPLADWLR